MDRLTHKRKNGIKTGYTVFNYPISMANGWNYVKKAVRRH